MTTQTYRANRTRSDKDNTSYGVFIPIVVLFSYYSNIHFEFNLVT